MALADDVWRLSRIISKARGHFTQAMVVLAHPITGKMHPLACYTSPKLPEFFDGNGSIDVRLRASG